LTFSSKRLLNQTCLVSAGSLLIAGFTLLVTRIYTERYGSLDLSAVLLFRLYGSLLLACAALGLPIALQRTVAYLGAKPERAAGAALSGLVLAGASLAVGCSLSVIFAESIARLLDHPGAEPLWRAFMWLTYAQAFTTMVSLIQLARERVLESVATAVAAFGLSPLSCVLLLRDSSLSAVIAWTAVATGVTTLPSLLRIAHWIWNQVGPSPFREAAALLRYGVRRAPASALEPTLDLTLPWMAVVSGAGLIGAGYLAIGLALMRPLNPISGALSQVLIPASAAAIARGDFHAHAARARQVAQWALHGGTFATFQMVIWADVLIRVWLGPEYDAAAGVAAMVCLSLTPSFLFACLRGLIDGETERAVNTRNLCAAILVFGAASVLLGWLRLAGMAALGLAYLLSRTTLAVLTLRYVSRAYRVSFWALRPWAALASGALLGAGAIALRALLPAHYSAVAMTVYVPLAALAFTGSMTATGMEWTRPLRRRLWATS
jgi:O-antigen/teichoic acid export membrane protein